MYPTSIALVTSSLYLAIASFKGLQIAGKIVKWPSKLWLLSSLVAILLHGYLLYLWIDTQQGQNLSLSNLFSMSTWIVACIATGMAFKRSLESLMLLILPIASLSVLLALWFPGHAISASHSSRELFHIFCSLAALGLSALAAFQAALFSIQHYLLKKHQLAGWVQYLPPLQTMEYLLILFIRITFLVLTLLLITAYWSFQASLTPALYHKVLFSGIAWCVFASLLLGHQIRGWRGNTITRWTLAGAIILGLSYFGLKMMMEA